MFDIGFSEMMVIAVVALVVIGPEKLPKVARTLGAWTGRLQRYVNDVKADINREVELDELRKFKTQFEQTASAVENEIRAEASKVEAAFDPLAEAAAAPSGAMTTPGAPADAAVLQAASAPAAADLPAGTPVQAATAPPVSPAPDAASASGAARPAPPAAA